MKVKRYNLTNPYDCGMEKHPTGNYVRFEDYTQMCDYADRLVEHKDMVCLPADLENLRKANSHFAVENEALKAQRDRLAEAIITHRAKAFPLTDEDFDQELWETLQSLTPNEP